MLCDIPFRGWPTTRLEKHARRHLIICKRHASACWVCLSTLARHVIHPRICVHYNANWQTPSPSFHCCYFFVFRLVWLNVQWKSSKQSINIMCRRSKTCLKHLGFTSTLGSTNMHSKQWHQLKMIAFLQCKSSYMWIWMMLISLQSLFFTVDTNFKIRVLWTVYSFDDSFDSGKNGQTTVKKEFIESHTFGLMKMFV